MDEVKDLSGWQYVEAWTIDEAAMIWAGIDPLDYLGRNWLDALKVWYSVERYKKVLLHQRAIAEAVCSGSLSFIEALEQDNDYNNCEGTRVVFPDLPAATRILTGHTRIKQAAFLQWAKSKGILSARQELMRRPKNEPPRAMLTITDAIEPAVIPTASILVISGPDFRDKTHPCHAAELNAGVKAWEEVVVAGAHESGAAVKAAITAVLNKDPTLSNEAKKRLAVTANWNKGGGATKTPGT